MVTGFARPRAGHLRASLGSTLALALMAAATAMLSADATAADRYPATPEAKIDDYVATAKPTEDGTVHPMGREVKPRENWFTPCPPDRRIAKDGNCEDLAKDSAGQLPGDQNASGTKASRTPDQSQPAK